MIALAEGLPGTSWNEGFAREMAAALGPAIAEFVAVPRGFNVERCLDALTQALSGQQPAQVVRLESVSSPADLLRRLDGELGQPSTATEPELWVIERAAVLEWPRVFVVTASTPAAQATEVLACASTLAATSRDLQGPLSFVVVGTGGTLAAVAAARCWPPADVLPQPLPFWRPDRSLLRSGFQTYLSLRIYWEASGATARLERLSEVHRHVPHWSPNVDTDQVVDRWFDAAHAEVASDPLEAAEALARVLSPDQLRAAAATGTVPLRRGHVMHELVVAGLAWQPPGSPRAFVTAEAAFTLAQSASAMERIHLPQQDAPAFRRAVRRNEALAHWVQGLCLHLEREVRNFCRADDRIDQRIGAVGLTEKLETERQRQNARIAYGAEDRLIEFASFHDLLQIVRCTDLVRSLPTTVDRLHRVRLARNTAAHLRSVSWYGLEPVLAALEDFCAV